VRLYCSSKSSVIFRIAHECMFISTLFVGRLCTSEPVIRWNFLKRMASSDTCCSTDSSQVALILFLALWTRFVIWKCLPHILALSVVISISQKFSNRTLSPLTPWRCRLFPNTDNKRQAKYSGAVMGDTNQCECHYSHHSHPYSITFEAFQSPPLCLILL